MNVSEVLEKLPPEARAAAEQLGLADEQGLLIVSSILQEVGVAGLCAWAAYQEILESGNVDAFDMGQILGAALPTFERTIRQQERQRVREALKPTIQALDLEIERCQELGDIWAEEGIDAEFPADPDDRARFFHGQRDKLKELRTELTALDSLEDPDA